MRVDVPMRSWLRSYQRDWLGEDVIAGATVWAVLVPSALAYAGIVGVDPIVGLYTVPFALVLYALFGSSRLMVVGPDAAVSVLTAATVAPLVTGDDYLELVLTLALLVGAINLVFFVLRMGWVADLVPDPVLKGFIQGLVWVTILDQVPKLLGVQLTDPHDDFWRRTIDIVEAVDGYQSETALLGLLCLVALFAMAHLTPRLPAPLLAVAAAIVAVAALGLDGEGVAVVGEPTGAPFDFGLPTGVDASQIVDLLPGALAITVLGFTQSMGAAKSAAQQTGERIDPNQELLALGASNLASGASGGYPVTGTLSKTSVAIASGGRTQVGNLVAAALGVITILVLRPLLEWLALAALAAIVVFAMSGMSDIAYFRRLWRVSRIEFAIGLVAFLGVLTFGVLPGVLIGVTLSLVTLVQHIGNAPSAVLGRTPSGAWVDVDRDDEAAQVPGLTVWRQEAPIVFLNARRLANRLRALADDRPEVIVVDASVTSGIDSTGYVAFTSAIDELESLGIELWIVHPLARVLETAAAHADAASRPMAPVHPTIDAAVAAFRSGRRTIAPDPD